MSGGPEKTEDPLRHVSGPPVTESCGRTVSGPAVAEGTVRRISGPLVEIEGLEGVALFDVVELGPRALHGEIVAIREDTVVAQVYEYTGGVAPGERAASGRRPLSVGLGPGLLGGIFDGLLRPLAGGREFLEPGSMPSGPALDRPWPFRPMVEPGREVEPGAVLGTVAETGAIEHRLLVPPGLRGALTWIAPAGELRGTDPVARIGDAHVPLVTPWAVRQPRPSRGRLHADVRLVTGQRVVDLFYPLCRGSTAAVPGGFGTGKTMLLQQIAKWCDADVIVYVGCGERGNEMADLLQELPTLVDPRSGRSLMERTVVIANTSNMPVMAREASVYTGLTVAEYYRDMGHDTVVIADSISRWAQALREFGSATGELPAEEGFPASLGSALASFFERAGRVTTLGGAVASTTLIAAVSPPGGDKTEPVTAHTQRFVRGLWSLDRDLAAARHYPAVSWRGSFSRDVAAITPGPGDRLDPAWAGRRARAMEVLAAADRLEGIVQLVGASALPDHERVVLLAARLIRQAVLQQNALSPNDASCGPTKQEALLEMVLALYDRCLFLIDGGVPVALIEEVDLSDAVRVRERVGPVDAAGVEAVRDDLLARLGKLR